MNLTRALDLLKLKEEEVLCFYIYGSRLWGSATYSSDWDIVVVTKSASSLKDKTTTKVEDDMFLGGDGIFMTHVGQLDACIMTHAEFLNRLKQHRWLNLILPYLPPEAIWKNTNRFVEKCKVEIKFDPLIMFERLRTDTERDLKVAKKMIGKGKTEKGSKILQSCLQDYLLLFQILEKGKITQFNGGYKIKEFIEIKLRERVDQNDVDLWNLFSSIYDPILLALNKRFTAKTSSKQVKNKEKSK